MRMKMKIESKEKIEKNIKFWDFMSKLFVVLASLSLFIFFVLLYTYEFEIIIFCIYIVVFSVFNVEGISFNTQKMVYENRLLILYKDKQKNDE